MKIKLFTTILLILSITASAQKANIDIRLTANYYDTFIPFDSILIRNISQNTDTMLYYPDTILQLDIIAGIDQNKVNSGNFQPEVFPNPAINGKTQLKFFNPEEQSLNIQLNDIYGRKLHAIQEELSRGYHSIDVFTGKEEFYLLNISGKTGISSIKILNVNSSSGTTRLAYSGTLQQSRDLLKDNQNNTGFLFSAGDTLRYITYASTPQWTPGSDVLEDTPFISKTMEFEIIEGVPCPDIAALRYQGKLYSTVQIYNQCWLKENLDAGIMVHGDTNMKNNNIIEKYCYDNDSKNCEDYGALYQWEEAMNYEQDEFAQGICPQGWHIPTKLETFQVRDSLNAYNYSSGEIRERGSSHWLEGNESQNVVGFTALPGGYRGYNSGTFEMLFEGANFWTSTEWNVEVMAWTWQFYYYGTCAWGTSWQTHGISVRCIKDQ